ncbi:MAG: hypothetical protein CL999_001075, partial [Methanobacteriota archaeon]
MGPPPQYAGRSDGKDCDPVPLHRSGDIRSNSAFGGNEIQQLHRRDKQGPRSSNFHRCRLRNRSLLGRCPPGSARLHQ